MVCMCIMCNIVWGFVIMWYINKFLEIVLSIMNGDK